MSTPRSGLWLVTRCAALVVSLCGARFSVAAPPESTIAGPPVAKNLEWQGEPGWPLAVPHRKNALAVVGKDDNVVFGAAREGGKDDRASWVQRVRFHRQVVWQHNLPPEFLAEADIAVDKDTVFVAHYCVMSSGATIHALDLATGKARWSTPVKGLGPIDHSKYSNHVVLKLIRGYLVAFGNEAQGRYIEIFDPQSGKMLSNHRLPAAKPGQGKPD
jgi:hypothetical protein